MDHDKQKAHIFIWLVSMSEYNLMQIQSGDFMVKVTGLSSLILNEG